MKHFYSMTVLHRLFARKPQQDRLTTPHTPFRFLLVCVVSLWFSDHRDTTDTSPLSSIDNTTIGTHWGPRLSPCMLNDTEDLNRLMLQINVSEQLNIPCPYTCCR